MQHSLIDPTSGDQHRLLQRRKWTTLVSATVLVLPAQVAAQAIAPSQVTPRSIVPAPGTPIIAPVAREGATSAGLPDGADLSFVAGDAVIEGAFPEMARANAAFEARVSHQTLSVAALFAAARELEQAYARAGYLLARVTVPHQRIADGQPVRVVVTDGFIEAIDAAHVPASIRPRVMGRLAGLIGQRHLTEARIERHLLVPGQLPGLALRSALARGREPGGVLLVLEGTMQRTMLQLAAENPLPASLGQWQLSGSLSFNNALGAGEQIYLTGATGLDGGADEGGQARLRMAGGGIVLPLGSAGEYLSSQTRPRTQRGAPEALGTFERVQGRIHLPLVLRRATALNLDLKLEHVRQSLHLPGFSLDLSRDRYTALRIGVSGRSWLGQVPLTYETELSTGLGGRRASAMLPLSRQGASPRFSRLDGRISADVPLADGFELGLVLRGQTGLGEAQLLSEQFSLDAADGVSTFAAGSFNVDSGATLRGELRLPMPALGKSLRAVPYMFGAAGSGTLAQPTALEKDNVAAGVMGIGTRFVLGGSVSAAILGIEYGSQTSNLPGRRRGHRAALSLRLGF